MTIIHYNKLILNKQNRTIIYENVTVYKQDCIATNNNLSCLDCSVCEVFDNNSDKFIEYRDCTERECISLDCTLCIENYYDRFCVYQKIENDTIITVYSNKICKTMNINECTALHCRKM